MKSSSHTWSRWLLPGGFLLVLALSGWAWWIQPESTLVCRERLGAQPIVPLPGQRGEVALPGATPGSPIDRTCLAWRLDLRLAASLKPPGPEWMMFEGSKPGEGYELHWLPNKMGVQVFRAADQVLLGGISTDRFPEQVTFARRGYRLEVWIDGRLALECLDPLTTPPPSAWGFQTTGDMRNSTISLYHDRHLLDAPTVAALRTQPRFLAPFLTDLGRGDHAILRVRYALGFDPEKASASMADAIAEAVAAVRGLGAAHPDRARLQHWLAWGEIRLALVRQDLDAAERVNAAVDQLMVLGAQAPVSETPGLLMDVLDRLAFRACVRPTFRSPPDEVLSNRRAWMVLLASVAAAADTLAPAAMPDDWRWQLRLLVHGADCLVGLPPKPTPAEAPDWVVCRWRAFAGGDPGGPTFASSIPVLSEERNPIRPALEKLLLNAGFEKEKIVAVAMRARLLAALERLAQFKPDAPNAADRRRQVDEDLQAALDSAPMDEAKLARALLALHDIGDPLAARNLLNPEQPPADGRPVLAQNHALAYAFDRLLWHRFQEPRSVPGKNLFDKPKLPEKLSSFAHLLSGEADATYEAWLTNDAALPPVQALAAALAMQEVMGLPDVHPDWSLLDQIPCFTLPLHLMKPLAATPTGNTPGVVTPKPPRVP